MAEALLPIVGVCRFSYLGIGDWKAFHAARKGRTFDEVIAENRKTLFDDARMKERFSTFEKITLPSLAQQSDKHFRFIVLTSDELPDVYANRLKSLAAKHAFVHLVFAPVGRAVTVFNEIYESDFGLKPKDMLQFRLDDDDGVGRNYIARMREIGNGFHALDRGRAFAVTFPNVLMVGRFKDKIVARHRHYPNTAAGQAMYHPSKNVMDWAHHIVDRRVISISEWYNQWVLQTFLSRTNDSGAMSEARMDQLGVEVTPEQLEKLKTGQFRFMQTDDKWWQSV